MEKLIRFILKVNLHAIIKKIKIDRFIKKIYEERYLKGESEYTRLLKKTNINDTFTVIDIETIALCNRGKTSCESYCPVSTIKRENSYMKDEAYYKIIDDLASINFNGSIRPHFYSEPLLDKRLVKFVKYARENCPKAEILIKSNGDYLTYEKYKELVEAGVSKFKITQYDGYFQKNIVDIFLELNKEERKNFIVRVLKEFYENRGMYEREDDGWVINEVCDFPLLQMFITSDGDAVVCPNDYDGKEVILGNVIKNKLTDIWESDDYLNIRKHIQQGNRRVLGQLCMGCNHPVDLHESTKYVFLE
jgi:radical SAM protein with 4Fe4S-binding SPASM domain